jgi:hypothetical protein
MTPRLPFLPTLAQFLEAAKAQGCTVRLYKGRTVVENPQVGIPVAIPPMAENEALTQFLTEYFCRLLRIGGFGVDPSPSVKGDFTPSIGEES